MKTCNSKSKPASKRSKQVSRCSLKIQGFSQNQVKAMRLVSKWENKTPHAFCAEAIMGYVGSSFEEMRAVALDTPVTNHAEKEWAGTFFECVETLLGFSEEEKATFRQLWKSGTSTTLERLEATLSTQEQDACRPFMKENHFDYMAFIEDTSNIMGSRRYGPHEALHRDVIGNLFILTYSSPESTIKQISYDEACTWLAGSGQGRPPEKWLALFGITRPQNVQTQG